MFRYSRDVKRCGPVTKAGAPVGVVYCLSTSSFFILMLALELNVSAFGIGDATCSRSSTPATITNLWARHCKPGRHKITSFVLEATRAPQFFGVAAEPSCPPPTRGGHRGLRLFWTRWPPPSQQHFTASDRRWSAA